MHLLDSLTPSAGPHDWPCWQAGSLREEALCSSAPGIMTEKSPAGASLVRWVMKLVLAVIQDADASTLMRVLKEQAFDVTKLASTGGFLREGNTTLMIGLDDERVGPLKALIQQTCRTRTRLVTFNLPMGPQYEGMGSEPMEVAVGGAVLFVLDVQEFVKI